MDRAPGLGITVDEVAVREADKVGHAWRNPVWTHADGSFAEWRRFTRPLTFGRSFDLADAEPGHRRPPATVGRSELAHQGGPVDVLQELTRRKILAIVRADGPERALACIRTLVNAGITALEVSLTTPGAAEAIAAARSEVDPSVLIGAGTVLTARQADEVAAARAEFVVTPAITRGAHRSLDLGLPLLCGALTPTEVVTVLDLGATAVKIFPAKVHGPGYLRELLAPLPFAPLIAVGGVDADTAPGYLSAGALAVGVGSPLLGDAGTGGSLTDLSTRAREFLAALTGSSSTAPAAPSTGAVAGGTGSSSTGAASLAGGN